MQRILSALILALSLALPLAAQESVSPPVDRSATGGAQTLEDILARQRGDTVDDAFRRTNIGDAGAAAGITQQLGTLGGASDPELWRALRYGAAGVSVSAGGEVASVIVQDGGMRWLQLREGELRELGGSFLLVVVFLLTIFFLTRDRIRIEGGTAGRTVTRFKAFERFAHWLLAGSFILLGLTGLLTLFGRVFIAPMLGREVNATVLLASKWIHNNVAWAFMVGLVLVFVLWVVHNLPSRHDVTWIRQGGGIIGAKHPPAKKFNAGQKLIFWSVIILGASIAASGVSLLFPFELPLFAKTFAVLNQLGVPGWMGMDPFPTALTPHEEMHYVQLWHAIVSFLLMGIIIAHIYIGSIGMEGAFDAMGSGEVDEAWARQHHSIWLDEVEAAQDAARQDTTPAA